MHAQVTFLGAEVRAWALRIVVTILQCTCVCVCVCVRAHAHVCDDVPNAGAVCACGFVSACARVLCSTVAVTSVGASVDAVVGAVVGSIAVTVRFGISLSTLTADVCQCVWFSVFGFLCLVFCFWFFWFSIFCLVFLFSIFCLVFLFSIFCPVSVSVSVIVLVCVCCLCVCKKPRACPVQSTKHMEYSTNH